MGFFEFLAVGELGFWIVIALSAIFVSSLADDDHPVSATMVGIGTFVLLSILGNFNPMATLRAHADQAVYIVPAYFLAGAVWGTAKWWFYLGDVKRKILPLAEKFDERIKSDIENAENKLKRAKQEAIDGPRSEARRPYSDYEMSILQGRIAQAEEELKDTREPKYRMKEWKKYLADNGINMTIPPLITNSQNLPLPDLDQDGWLGVC